MPVARAMRAAAANQIMMLAVNPLSSVCTNVHRDQYCTTRIELLVILSFTHFYGRAAAELSFSDLVLRTFTGLMKTVISYNSLNLYLYKSYRCSDNERESKVTGNIFHGAHGTGTVGGGQKLVSRSAMHTSDHLTWFREGTRCAEFHHLDIRGEVLAIGARIEQRAAGAP